MVAVLLRCDYPQLQLEAIIEIPRSRRAFIRNARDRAAIGGVANGQLHKRPLISRTPRNVVEDAIGLGVCVSVASPALCSDAISSPTAMPTDSVG